MGSPWLAMLKPRAGNGPIAGPSRISGTLSPAAAGCVPAQPMCSSWWMA